MKKLWHTLHYHSQVGEISVNHELRCWKCQATQSDEPLPLSRRAECSRCGADLHVCRQCEFFDPKVSESCREPIAEPVLDKTKANFCGYFVPVSPERERSPEIGIDGGESGIRSLVWA